MSRQYNSHNNTVPSAASSAAAQATSPVSSSTMPSSSVLRSRAAASNGNGTALNHNGSGDLYQQLIDSNDLVKELDDIEAISQQISQHAEVLYQNWKSNSLPANSSVTRPSSQTTTASMEHPQRVSSASTTYGAGVGFPKRSIIENGYTNGNGTISKANGGANGGPHYSPVGHHQPVHHLQQHQVHQQPHYQTLPSDPNKHSPLSSPTSTLTSPSFISKTLPSRSHSVESNPQSPPIKGPSEVNSGNSGPPMASKLDLLTSPVVNGNLKDLVNSFVSTDRAKQAARQTISQTITNQMNRKNQFRSPSPSSASSSSSFSSRGMSPPLRSPMLASSLTSPLPTSERRLMDAFPSSASIMNNVHTKMPPLFSSGQNETSQTASPLQQQQPPKWPQEPEGQVIRIPVQHLPSNASAMTSNSGPKSTSGNGPLEANLRSPSMLHQMASTAPATSTTGSASIPSLHAAHVENMKKRFEEAKERINAMHQRATSGLPFMSPDPFGADEIDFFGRNRRQPQRPLIAPPHPELTPQQKQHISERSSPANFANSNAVNPLMANSVQPPKRFGGSVAERVMIFERCPIFGTNELKEPRMPALLSNSKPTSSLNNQVNNNASLSLSSSTPASTVPLMTSPVTSNLTSAAPWRNVQYENMGKIQTPRVAKVRDIPIATPSSFSSVITPPTATTTTTTSTLTSAPSVTSSATSTLGVTPTPLFLSTPSPTTPLLSTTSRGSSASTSPASTLSRLSRPPSIIVTGKEKVLPKFHFPLGNPATAPPSDLTRFSDEFRKHQNSAVNVDELGEVLKACGYPFYWKAILFSAAGGEKTGLLSYVAFSDFWRKMCATHHDEAAQFMHILAHHKSRSHIRTLLTPEDFVPLVQDVVDSHPGLGFLKEATEFHSRYVHTVIARIFFVVNRSWSGLITLSELRKSNLLATIRILEEEEDINQITDFFSYEHFYVIYCKFWELDKDHDLFIDREDLSRHNDHAISARMIDRIFSGAVTRGAAQKEGKMSYTEFVWFLLAEEDKRASTSIEYWFRCMDLDGDGYLSMYELEYFYEEQLQRMEQLGIETLPFEDCLCQMLDMIMPKKQNVISLQDLKRCRMTPIFFDTFFNLEKYLDHEQRDPFASQRDVDEDGNEMSDWDRFAAEEYELLVAEEGNADGMDDMGLEDDPEGHAEMQLEQALDDNDLVYHDNMIAANS